MGQQTKYVGTGTQVNIGELGWNTPGNITALDGSVAEAVNDSGTGGPQSTNVLRGLMQGNNFVVPLVASIIGIVLEVNKRGSAANSAADVLVRLVKAGAQVGDDKPAPGFWSTLDSWVSYGGPTDLWGTTWSPAEISADDFGADFIALMGDTDAADVDAFRITVYYNSPADTILTAVPNPSNDFGGVLVTTPSPSRTIDLYNFSTTDIVVTALTFNGDFSDAGAPVAVPFTLHANNADGPTSVPILVTPAARGLVDQTDALAVTHNGTNNPLNVEMKATGVLVVSAFVVNSSPLVPLIGVRGTTGVLQVNPDDLDCEESASFTRWYDYTLSLLEKALMRLILRVEDIGQFTFQVATVTPNRPLVTADPVTAGVGSRLILNVFSDFEVSDDLLQITVSRDASSGPMMINNMFHKIEPRGEYVERT